MSLTTATTVCATQYGGKSFTKSSIPGLIISEIDSYLNENYTNLLRISRGMCRNYGKTYDPAIVVSEAYLHVRKNREKIHDENTLQRFFIAKMRLEISKTKSTINRSHVIKDNPEVYLDHLEHEDDVDIYEDEMRVIERYRQTPDRVKTRVLEVYFDDHIYKVRDMAKYFNISTKSANKLIQELKADLTQLQEKPLY